MRLVERFFLLNHTFRQRDKFTDSPDSKHDVHAFAMRAHHLVQKPMVDVECVHPGG